MNGVDLLLLALVVFFLWLGWQKGFISGITDLLIWIGSLIAGFFYYQPLSSFLERQFTTLGAWSKPVAFILLIILSRILLSALFNRLLKSIPSQSHTNPVNKTLGLFLGFINGVLNAAIVTALLLVMPFSNSITTSAEQSKAAENLTGPLQWFNEKMSPIFAEALAQPARNKTIYPSSDETVKLPFTVTHTKPQPALETQMIQLVNNERTKQGLPKLTLDAALTPVARAHSRDMLTRGYFSHYSLEGKAVSDRLKAADIRYLSAGENLALAPTLKAAHTGLMNSPGHRANILHKAYGKIGIGIMDGGIRGLMVTQIFKN